MKKYVITGSTGHTSKPIATALTKAGHEVVVITSKQDRVKEIESIGAKAAVGNVEDAAFLTKAFAGADAVYLMIPPNFNPGDNWRKYQNQIADNYIAALKANNITYAVLLSSIGAHLGNGTGPIDGLADFEKKLSALPALHVKNLRPSYFYYNLLGMIPLIKGMNVMGSNFGSAEEKILLTHPADIAEVAIEELLKLDFKGQTVRYIASDARYPDDIARVLSTAAGKPGIPWVMFSDEQFFGGLQQAGLPNVIAEGYTEMGRAFRSGELQKDFWAHPPASMGKIRLEDFAKEFEAAYKAN